MYTEAAMKQLLMFIFTLTLFPALVSATEPDLSTPALAPVREYLAKNNLKITQKPEDVIISGYVLVLGVGTGPNERMARFAADAVALRNLASVMADLPLSGNRVIKTVEESNDAVITTISGYLKGGDILFNIFNAEQKTCYLLRQRKIRGAKELTGALYDLVNKDPAARKTLLSELPLFSVKPPETTSTHDALIIDLTTLAFKPALFNRLVSEMGELVFDPTKADKAIIQDHAPVLFADSEAGARKALADRGAQKPLLIKAKGISQGTDIVLADTDARIAVHNNSTTGVFTSIRVAVIIKP
jgi:hypothetical protein